MPIALTNALYPGHPSMELLERFLLHHVAEDELDRVETHILACEDCVLRLEDLEVQMAATKLALQQLAQTGLRAQSSNHFSLAQLVTNPARSEWPRTSCAPWGIATSLPWLS